MKVDLSNGLGFALALLLAMLGGGLLGPAGEPHVERPTRHALALETVTAASGERALLDAGGVPVPLRRYRRIASATLVADRVLADLCEPDRIVAFTRYASRTPSAHRYAGKPGIGARDGAEAILAHQPDLLLVSDLVDPQLMARLREHGVQVFDLGSMRGLPTLLRSIRAIALLIGAPERGEPYTESLARRLAAVAPDVPDTARPRALYLSLYGDRLFGAAGDTSYHDVLTAAGLRDAAAERGLTGWPELTGEQVLAIAPDVIVTRTGMGALLCRHPGLDSMGPCQGRGRIVELDGALLDDPGPALLDAAEQLHAALHRRDR